MLGNSSDYRSAPDDENNRPSAAMLYASASDDNTSHLTKAIDLGPRHSAIRKPAETPGVGARCERLRPARRRGGA